MHYTVFRVKRGCKIGGVLFSGGLGFTEHRRPCVADFHPMRAELIFFVRALGIRLADSVNA